MHGILRLGCLQNGSLLNHVHLMIAYLKGNFVDIQKDIDKFVSFQREDLISITIKLPPSVRVIFKYD